jgi:hypothetical protein
MHFAVTRLRVDNDELEPDVTTGDLEVARTERGETPGPPSWALTVVTVDEPWHHGHGECQLVIDVEDGQRFRGQAVLVRSDRGRWHYFEGAGNLERLDDSTVD